MKSQKLNLRKISGFVQRFAASSLSRRGGTRPDFQSAPQDEGCPPQDYDGWAVCDLLKRRPGNAKTSFVSHLKSESDYDDPL
jgi:hypothetical protein